MSLSPTRCIYAKPILVACFLVLISAGSFLPKAIAHFKSRVSSATLATSGPQESASSRSSDPNNGPQASPEATTASDSPASTEAANFVVNVNGDAADNTIGNGICDSSGAVGDQCTLRAAIQEANAVFGSDTITFNLPAGSTITLNTALPEINGSLTINGPGSNLLTVMRSTAGATPSFRIFRINSGATATISGLTITNGKTADGLPAPVFGNPGENGGGILNAGTLTLNDDVITGNTTGKGAVPSSPSDSGTAYGGNGGLGGGIFSSGSLTMSNVTVSNNTTGGGAIAYYGGGGGSGAGIYLSSGTLTMTSCTVTGNDTSKGSMGTTGGFSSGGGGAGGGIFVNSGAAAIISTTISDNTTGSADIAGPSNSGQGGPGGGIYISFGNGNVSIVNSSISGNHTGDGVGFLGQGGFGGGIFNSASLTITRSSITANVVGKDGVGGGIDNSETMVMSNSTVSGNRTTGSSGSGGGIWNARTATLTNCTIVFNETSNGFGGSGIHHYSDLSVVNIRNTIVARNSFPGNPNATDVSSGPAYNSQGHNLIGNADGSTGFTSIGDQVGTSATPLDPLLAPLANNGGSTLTHPLLIGSSALDAGDDCVTQAAHCGDATLPQLTTDQRGTGFSRIVDGPDGNTTATVDIGAYEKQVVFPNIGPVSTNEDTTLVLGFEVTDSASITSITATSSNTTLVPNNPANINVTGTALSRVLTIIPASNAFGTSDITVTVNRTGSTEIRRFVLTVNPVNDVPAFTKGLDQSVNENSAAQTVNNWATNISPGPANESGQMLSFQIVSNSNPGLFSVAPAITPSGTLTFTPAAGVSGSALITLALMDNGGTSIGGDDTSDTQTFNINVLEGGTLIFNVPFFSQNENGGGTVITVSRFGGSAGEARVNYATSDGTATAGQDYTATSGTLIFPAGVTVQSFPITISNDLVDESNETVNLTLSNPDGSGALGSQSTALLSIVDDDPTPTLRIDDVSVNEGSSGTTDAVFTVTLSAPSSFTVTANFATAEGSAVAPSDYLSTNGVVTFNPGDLTKTVSVTVNGDTTPEVHESFFVNLSNITNSFPADSQGIGTILSDDAPGGTIAFNVMQNSVDESAGFATIVVNRTGETSAAVTVDYATPRPSLTVVPCSTASGFASERCDYTSATGTLRFAAGDASKSIVVLINQDNFVEGPEILALALFNPTGGAVLAGPLSVEFGILTILDDVTEPTQNPIDNAESFVRQHYHDFLNREADPGGLAFWTDQIVSCGADPQCIEIKRINVSAAFFLSIEFQETGYLVERTYKVAYGSGLGTSTLGGFHQFPVPIVRIEDFLPDTQEIGRDVIVGQPGWELTLENNKQAFAARFVQRARFILAFPSTLTESQFVDGLNTNAGGVLLPDERIQLINDLATGAKTRAQVVRIIAEDSDLAISERNRAFVLMQYLGYMRRNPNNSPDADHTGYEFWLNKLNEFDGNFVNAEMVKAFIISGEYRQRFGP